VSDLFTAVKYQEMTLSSRVLLNKWYLSERKALLLPMDPFAEAGWMNSFLVPASLH
jgi:hypothetical protein